MQRVIKRCQLRNVPVSGSQATGWRVGSGTGSAGTSDFIIEITDDGSGYLLLVSNLDRSLYFDEWYETADAATAAANLQFGLTPASWVIV